MSTESGGPLHVGWSSVNITPDQPVMLSGQFSVRVSQGVADPVTATVLALETRDDQAVMVSCDLVGIETSILHLTRQKLEGKIDGFDVRKLFMNATHTHSGPVMKEGLYPRQALPVMAPAAYAELLTDRIAAVVLEAWNRRQPGGFSRAYGHAVVGHNRRAWYSDGHAEMYGQTDRKDFDCLEGCEDHGVDMLFFWDVNRRLTGLVVNLACPSQVSEQSKEVTADYWHEVRTVLRKTMGQEIFIMPQCSAAGDQSPHFLLHGREEEDMRNRRGTSERDEIAYRIGQAVEHALPLAQSDIQWAPRLGHVARRVALSPRIITRKEMEAAQRNRRDLMPRATDANGVEHALLNRAESVVERYRNRSRSKPYGIELHVLRLGDVAMATSPFELFLDYGLRIKARSRAVQTFTVQLACGVGGYLPTARAVKAGGYEAEPASNNVGPEGGQELVEKSLAQIQKLFA